MSRPSKREVHAQFERYNVRFFRGALPHIPIKWCRMNHYGDCFPPCPRNPIGLIRLSSKDMPPCGWRGILLHEMIHAWRDLQGEHPPVDVATDHGPGFTAECNRIGRKLGLPYVPVSESWSWPWGCEDFDDLDVEQHD